LHGKKIEKDKKYRVAFPAEISHAVKVSLPKKAQSLFPGLQPSGKYYWNVMEEYIRKNSPIKCLTKQW
jgi:hypothetical protein